MKMKHLNFQVEEGRIHLKAFPGAKANQLNHYVIPTLEEFNYDCALIHVGISDIVPSKEWGEWPSGLRRCSRIGRFPVQTPLGARPGLGTQPRYEAPGDLRAENVKRSD